MVPLRWISDTILTRLASSVISSAQALRVPQTNSSNWARFYSRMRTLELESYEHRAEGHSCDLGLLDRIYVVRPNQCKSSVRDSVRYIRLYRLIINEDICHLMEGLAFLRRYGCPRKLKRLCYIMGQHEVGLYGKRIQKLGFKVLAPARKPRPKFSPRRETYCPSSPRPKLIHPGKEVTVHSRPGEKSQFNFLAPARTRRFA